MSSLRINSIQRGDYVQAGDKWLMDTNEFLGFYTDNEGTGLGFATLRELKSQVADQGSHYAIFRSVADGCNWAAYFWNGRWRVGSSANTLKLAAA